MPDRLSLLGTSLRTCLLSVVVAACSAPSQVSAGGVDDEPAGGGDAMAPAAAGPAAGPAAGDPEAGVLADADRAFAADVAERGLEGWLRWFTDDAVKFDLGGSPPRIGKAAIAAGDAALFASGLTVVFGPDASGWLDPGRRGYTSGRWELRPAAGPVDAPAVASGRYLTLWIHTDEGWRVELDVGAADPVAGTPDGEGAP